MPCTQRPLQQRVPTRRHRRRVRQRWKRHDPYPVAVGGPFDVEIPDAELLTQCPRCDGSVFDGSAWILHRSGDQAPSRFNAAADQAIARADDPLHLDDERTAYDLTSGRNSSIWVVSTSRIAAVS
jgi:hypothetical protein